MIRMYLLLLGKIAYLLTGFRVLSLGGVVIGTLVFGGAMWATYSGDPLRRFTSSGRDEKPPTKR